MVDEQSVLGGEARLDSARDDRRHLFFGRVVFASSRLVSRATDMFYLSVIWIPAPTGTGSSKESVSPCGPQKFSVAAVVTAGRPEKTKHPELGSFF